MSKWTLVRLELAPTPEFPAGSASRAYMLHAPLDAAGLIDEAALAQAPAMATVRRFWPNEADQTGQLVRDGKGWSFSRPVGDDGHDGLCRLEARPLRQGACLTITDADGTRYRFRVVQLRCMTPASAATPPTYS
jgi:hypothetical protein